MRLFMQEYGRAILAAILGSLCILMCYTVIVSHTYEVQENEETISENLDYGGPVIISPQAIKIDIGDQDYCAISCSGDRTSEEYLAVYERYLSLVEGYENYKKEEKCQSLKVTGIEQIDITKMGRYHVIYIATNREGQSFHKKVEVIVR